MQALALIGVVTILSLMSFVPAFAEKLQKPAPGAGSETSDAAGLRQLQPLHPAEQPLYEQAKNDASELRKFIATRKYLRTVEQVVKKYKINEDKPTEADFAKFPPLSEDVVFDYTVDLAEQVLLFQITVHQGIR